MRIAVLGSGMAGLLAAKAVSDATELRPTIITNRIPQPIEWNQTYGIHVLHKDCGLDVPEMLITNLVALPDGSKPELLVDLSEWERKMANGTYGQKVYGSRKMETSIMRMPGVIEGYEYVTAYNKLVKMFVPDTKVYRPINELGMLKLCDEYDLVISSIPRHAITPKWVKHPFSIAYVSHLPPIDLEVAPYMGDNFVVYSVEPSQPWSRASRVLHNGYEFWNTEYITIPQYFVNDLKKIEKIQPCDRFVFPENLVTVGRFGEWLPGVLASDAYWKTVEELRVREMATV